MRGCSTRIAIAAPPSTSRSGWSASRGTAIARRRCRGSSAAPIRLRRALGGLLREPPRLDLRHVSIPTVSVAERLSHLRALLRRGRCTFDDAVRGADRATIAVTLFALLELHKRGEATWSQAEPFGEIAIERVVVAATAAAA